VLRLGIQQESFAGLVTTTISDEKRIEKDCSKIVRLRP